MTWEEGEKIGQTLNLSREFFPGNNGPWGEGADREWWALKLDLPSCQISPKLQEERFEN